MKISLIGINARFSHSCLALFCLRNELAANLAGVETRISQFTINDPYYLLLQRITGEGADYLFFSTLVWNSDLVERLIEDLLNLGGFTAIVVGGPQAGVVGARFTAETRVSVFEGEIEAAPGEFYRDLRQGWLRPRYTASFLHSPARNLGYPYRPEDFRDHLQGRAVYYESSRGCPFSCTYCLSSTERGLYHKPLERVFPELEEIIAAGPETVRFVDRTFNDSPDRALAIWRFLQQLDPATLFHFEIAPERFPEEMFAFLETVRPGLFQFEIGIQSTNPETLAAIRRPIDPAAAGEVVRRLRRLENIHLHADLILGLPFETPDSFRTSINRVFAMQPHYLQMGLLKLLPGTDLRARAAGWDYRAAARPPYPVFATRWLDQRALRQLYWLGECLERCCNNRYFPTLWRYLAGCGEDMAAFFAALADSFHGQGYFSNAVTQKTLVRLLGEHCAGRPDAALIGELILYDWLRCGHRFLPEELGAAGPGLEELRRQLFHLLPEEMAGVYDARGRKNFIRTAVFQRFSARALAQAGLATARDPALVCFLHEREERVHRLQKVLLLQIAD